MKHRNSAELVDFEMRRERGFRVFAPITSAARQWSMDNMPDSAESDGDRYTVRGSAAGEVARQIDAEGFKMRDVSVPDAAPAAPQTPDASALMLAALKAALPDYSGYMRQAGHDPSKSARVQAIRAAIAAAEGREG